MANPSGWPIATFCEQEETILHIQAAIGATGAVGVLVEGNEFLAPSAAPIVRDSAGVYSVYLKEGWENLRAFKADSVGTLDSTSGTYGVCTTDQTGTAPYKVIITMLRPDTGVAAEVRSGNELQITLWLRK